MRNRNRLEATSPWVLGRLALATLFCVAALLRAAADEPAEIEKRLDTAVRDLASDRDCTAATIMFSTRWFRSRRPWPW